MTSGNLLVDLWRPDEKCRATASQVGNSWRSKRLAFQGADTPKWRYFSCDFWPSSQKSPLQWSGRQPLILKCAALGPTTHDVARIAASSAHNIDYQHLLRTVLTTIQVPSRSSWRIPNKLRRPSATIITQHLPKVWSHWQDYTYVGLGRGRGRGRCLWKVL